MTGTNIVCGVKTCVYNDTLKGCEKKAVILNASGQCLSLEKKTEAEVAVEAAQTAAEGVLNYGA